jgi:transcriptional regulator with XRE-family HTH domain
MARADAGLTISELAKRAGVSRDTISTAERGHHSLQAATLNKLARALNKTPSALLAEEERLVPKAESRSSLEPSLFNGLEDERRLRYLRGWRAFVHGLARRWEKEPPKTAAEISPLFDTMTALVAQKVFEPSEASETEMHELMLLMVEFQRLNDIAATVEKGDEAEQRRATFKLIQENIGA